MTMRDEDGKPRALIVHQENRIRNYVDSTKKGKTVFSASRVSAPKAQQAAAREPSDPRGGRILQRPSSVYLAVKARLPSGGWCAMTFADDSEYHSQTESSAPI